MKSRYRTGKLLALLLALALSAACAVPAVTVESFAYAGSTDSTGSKAASSGGSQWYDSIPEMLAAGEYEEGVVIAGIDMSKAKKADDPSTALEEKKLRSGTEEIMSVDTGNVSEAESEEASGQLFGSWFSRFRSELSSGSDESDQNEGDQNDEEVCITSVRRSGMSTEKILRLLADDDSVVFAEPNYIKKTEPDNGDAEAAAGAAAEHAAKIAEETEGIDVSETEDEDYSAPKNIGEYACDASGLQWSSDENSTLHAANKKTDVSMKVPGWPAGSNMDHEIVTAVVDMPVDFSNPDLKDRAYTFSPELRAKLGCDEHGYNATVGSKDGKLYYFPGADHGTHVAGIIGASWDGKGISGVASDVRFVSVQISNEGYTSLIDILRGYNFIKDAVVNGVPIRIANNSWGLEQTSKALDAAVREAGKYGVLSFFAAGNENVDLNSSVYINGSLADNPYAVVVASTTPAGDLADSSSYGKGVVDLGAPGAGILSCIRPDSSQYIPALTENNKVYENFEDKGAGTPESAAVKVCQVGYINHVDEYGYKEKIPDPDKTIPGTEGIVVSGSKEMGFEGRNVLKIKIDKSKLGGGGGNTLALRMDFGDVSDCGISAGDMLGFSYGGKDELEPVRIVDTASGADPHPELFKSSNRNCWNTYSYLPDEKIDTKNLSFILEIVANTNDEIYLDTFGIGNELQPYGIKSGTSMATPAVSGSAAVIASGHYSELNGMSASDSAQKLADLVRASVRPMGSLKDMTSTGGIIDLSVDAERSNSTEQSGPVIKDISVSGGEVRLTGNNFGDVQGKAAVRKYVSGSNSAVKAEIASWTDSEAVLTLDKDFSGIIEAVLTASNGKKDTIVSFVSKSGNLFEKDHHIGSGTGEPFEFDEPVAADDMDKLGDFETSGILESGGGRLYYMPQVAKVEKVPAYRSLYCYDPGQDAWTACPAYPAWIRDASGAWLDGKLYVKGTLCDVDQSGTIPYIDTEKYNPDAVVVYSYTPGENSWNECSAADVSEEHTLFAAGGRMMLAGVTGEEYYYIADDKYPTVREYDPQSGAGEALGYSPFSEENPKAAYAGGRIYIFENEYWNRAYVLDKNMCADRGNLIDLPEFSFGENNRRDEEDCVLAEYDYSVVSCGDTLILTGPAAKYSSSDTFMLKKGEKAFRPCSRRISDAEVFMPAAAELDGRLYVIGSSIFEPDKRVFRSTEVSGLKPIKERVVKGRVCSCDGQKYIVTALPSKKSQGEVALKEAKDVKDVTVPAVVRLPDGKTYKVTSVRKSAFRGHAARTVTIGKNVRKISKNAFENPNAVKMIVRTKHLTKKSVKGSLKSSAVKTVQVKVGSKAQNRKYVRKYKKIFTKKNAGKKVTVKS